jgi:hypothetical protein
LNHSHQCMNQRWRSGMPFGLCRIQPPRPRSRGDEYRYLLASAFDEKGLGGIEAVAFTDMGQVFNHRLIESAEFIHWTNGDLSKAPMSCKGNLE